MIGRHFHLWEFVRSSTAARLGIPNEPSDEQVRNLRRLAEELLDPIRDALGPIRVTSGYRCAALNAAVAGSSATSAHVLGLAADIIPVDVLSGQMRLADAMTWVAGSGLPFDQLIYEYGRWLHVGAALPGRTPRRQVLQKMTGSGYEPFDADHHRVG